MIRSVILLILISLLLIGCTGTKSFDGRLYDIEESYFEVDCSNEVNKGKKSVEDIGYPCTVQITDKTMFSNENSNQLSVEDFTEEASVRVILANPKNISKSNESREVEAKEIILLNQ
ncbi:MAG: hypothetical protein ACQEWV_16045 [Bacillota bacterium]